MQGYGFINEFTQLPSGLWTFNVNTLTWTNCGIVFSCISCLISFYIATHIYTSNVILIAPKNRCCWSELHGLQGVYSLCSWKLFRFSRSNAYSVSFLLASTVTRYTVQLIKILLNTVKAQEEGPINFNGPGSFPISFIWRQQLRHPIRSQLLARILHPNSNKRRWPIQ